MNRVCLLLVVLSVCALHAGDEKEEQEAMSMEQIGSLQHLMNVTRPILAEDYGDYKIYRSKVIAFITSSYLSRRTFTLNQDDPTAVSFGIVKCWHQERDHDFSVFNLALKRFLKMSAVDGNYDLARVSYGGLECKPFAWKQGDEEFIARSELKIRWATQDEKVQLKQAILNGEAKLDYDLDSDKQIALG
jgi:hypothetical protein